MRGLWNWRRSLREKGSAGRSGKAFGPYSLSLFFASSEVRPSIAPSLHRDLGDLCPPEKPLHHPQEGLGLKGLAQEGLGPGPRARRWLSRETLAETARTGGPASSRMRRITSSPGIPGMMRSHTTRSNPSARRLRPTSPFGAQTTSCPARSRKRRSMCPTRGSSSITRMRAIQGQDNPEEAPLSSSLSTSIRPPWASTMCLEMKRPSPVPATPRTPGCFARA